MGDEYTERKIRVYNVKKHDENKITKAAMVVPRAFYNFATGDKKKERVQA